MKVGIFGEQQKRLLAYAQSVDESPTSLVRDLLQQFLDTIEQSQLAESNHNDTQERQTKSR